MHFSLQNVLHKWNCANINFPSNVIVRYKIGETEDNKTILWCSCALVRTCMFVIQQWKYACSEAISQLIPELFKLMNEINHYTPQKFQLPNISREVSRSYDFLRKFSELGTVRPPYLQETEAGGLPEPENLKLSKSVQQGLVTKTKPSKLFLGHFRKEAHHGNFIQYQSIFDFSTHSIELWLSHINL